MKKYIKHIFILSFALTLNSCLVDDSAASEANDDGPNFVGFTAATVNASVVADGSESSVALPVKLEGPTSFDYTGEFTVSIAVDPASTAIAGVHYRLDSNQVTISSENNGVSSLPITIITEGIEPPLDPNPKLILNITDISDSSLLVNGRTSSITVTIDYLCFSDISGVYSTSEALYYRLGVLTATETGWPSEIEIQYICLDTYRVLEYFGQFAGNEFYFTVDEESGTIAYPATTPTGDAQSGNGQPFITCQSNPGDFSQLPCGAGATNKVVRTGDDIALYMTFGYFTAGSGPRIFYQVLNKIL